MKIRTLVATMFAGASLLSAGIGTAADWKPPGPIHLQIGFGAGGETDTMGRVVASVMEEQTGWQVIAVNKPGGGGVAMFTGIAAMPPDGTVIGLGVNMPILINLMQRGDKLPFKLESFDYLATVAQAILAMVTRKDSPFDDVAGLVEYSKAKGGAPVAFDAKTQELVFKAISAKNKTELKLVSVKSSAEMIQYLLGGQVVAAIPAGAHVPYLESGRLKMLAVINSERHDYAPETKTLKEQGYDLAVDPYFYIAAPKGLPAEVKASLSKALANAIASDKVKDVVSKTLYSRPVNLGADGTDAMMKKNVQAVKDLFAQ